MSFTLSPAIRARFGNREYYFTTMKALDAQREIKLPNQLFEVSARALDQRMQRDLEASRRVAPMAEYLRHDYRFYGPLIVALKGGDPTFIPLVMAEPNAFVDPGGFEFGVLRFDGTQDYFVLDGQHRLASISAAIEQGNEDIKEDDLGIVIVRHTDSPEGRVETRRLFTHLNRWAKATTTSENITIDEDDGLAIITRLLVRDHELLRNRVWYKTRQLPAGGDDNGVDATECFSTLETIYNCNELILRAKHTFPSDWKRVRPEADELDELYKECKEFWDGLYEMNEVREIVQGTRQPIDFRPEDPRGEGHLLFRPIGQEMLAAAVARILPDTSITTFGDIGGICRTCTRIDWRLASAPWRGVFFGEGGRMLGSRSRRTIGANLLRYMLGVPWPDTEGLLEDYRNMVYPADPESEEALELCLPPTLAANGT